MDHPYGHLINDLIKFFNRSFDFTPNARNLYSVSGFSYYHCKNDDASLKNIFGSWQSTKHIIPYRNSTAKDMIDGAQVSNIDTSFSHIPKKLYWILK